MTSYEYMKSDLGKDKLHTGHTQPLEYLYWKTKLIVHNFTVYDLKTKNGYCYLWNESEGGLTANEFTTIICNFCLKQIELQNCDKLLFYSDGCNYQNRNTTLSNALLNLAINKNVTIIQKFLIKGHTQMEADTMHSTIERKLKNTEINIPADYVSVCKNARIDPGPYEVKYLTYDYFRNYEVLKFYSSVRPGLVTGDPVVTDVRAFKHNLSGFIEYKVSFDDDWRALPKRVNKSAVAVPLHELPQLHSGRLKIKYVKFCHLQDLKSVLLEDYDQFCDNFPHSSKQ